MGNIWQSAEIPIDNYFINYEKYLPTSPKPLPLRKISLQRELVRGLPLKIFEKPDTDIVLTQGDKSLISDANPFGLVIKKKTKLIGKNSNMGWMIANEAHIYGLLHKMYLLKYNVEKLNNESSDDAEENESSGLNEFIPYPFPMTYNFICKDRSVTLYMEYINGGDLYDYFNVYPYPNDRYNHYKLWNSDKGGEKFLKWLIKQMIHAVSVCHQSGIIHRDIKPENFLIQHSKTVISNFNDIEESKFQRLDPTYDRIILSDFGLSSDMMELTELNKTKQGRKINLVGTPGFFPPEMVTNENVSIASDVFSLGITIFSIIYNSTPFKDDEGVSKYLESIKAGIQFPVFWTNSNQIVYISNELKDLIIKMVEYSPDTRITLKEALENHPFLQE